MEELDDVIVISNREAKIKALIESLMNGTKSLSYSALKAFKSSPNDFIQYAMREKVTTDAMMFGTIVHCLVLEPERFAERYWVLNDAEIISEIGGANPRATKVYKEWKAIEVSKNGDKQMVDGRTLQHAGIIAANVRGNRASRSILSRSPEHEIPIEWDFKQFKFRGIIDGKGKNCIFDLKTMADSDPRKAQRDIISMGYYLQAAMYLTAIGKRLPYYIVACDKKGGVSVHKITDDLIEYGFKEYERLLDAFNQCMLLDHFDRSHDFWSDIESGIYICDRPAYLYTEL